jgi:DNA-3-methyladenine glycosylase II
MIRVTMRPVRLTPDICATAARNLARSDPRLAPVIRRWGLCPLGIRPRHDAFAALVRMVVYQQLSGKAASTIHRRVLAAMDATSCPPAAAWLATPETTLRAAGLSAQKTRYIRDLCERVVAGTLPTRHLWRLPDDDVIAHLTQVKGVGVWTAQMFLMFQLQRPDVLPLGDLGIVNGFARIHGAGQRLTTDAMTALAETWRPWRTVACWYLWRALEMDVPG